MKKLATLAITLLLGASMALAQTGGDKSSLNPQPLPPGKKATKTNKKTKVTAASHKGGKKITPTAETKKGSGSTTPPPK